MNLALYSMSDAISIRRILYIFSKKERSSSLLVVTVVEGGSILWASKGRTCRHREDISGWSTGSCLDALDKGAGRKSRDGLVL
jgi:hypothetical protein